MAERPEIEALLDHYDLGVPSAWRRVTHGYVNETWIAHTTCGTYVVRRRSPSLGNPHLVRGQHALMHHLCAVGFPAPRVFASRRGATFVELCGRTYEVQQYLAGRLCDPARPAHVSLAARTLGWYHRSVAGFDDEALYRSRERYGALTLARTLRCLTRAWKGKIDAAARGLCASVSSHVADLEEVFCGFPRLPELVIHGDFYADNLICNGDEIAGVVDYDQAHWCWRVLEVAEALIYFAKHPARCLEHIVYSAALDLGAVERFLAAYSDVIRLSDAEICALPFFVRTIWMCAALDPPLGQRPDAEDAARVLPEVLYLADWAKTHQKEIQEIGFAVRQSV